MSATDEATESNSPSEYSDDRGLSGSAVAVTRVETGGEVPGIVQGACDITVDGEIVATRVLVDVDGVDHAIDTDAERVEVVS